MQIYSRNLRSYSFQVPHNKHTRCRQSHTHTHARVTAALQALQPLTDYSDLCIITSLTACTVQRQMLRMTHLGNKLFVLWSKLAVGARSLSIFSACAPWQTWQQSKDSDHSEGLRQQWNPPSTRSKQHKTLPYLSETRHPGEKANQTSTKCDRPKGKLYSTWNNPTCIYAPANPRLTGWGLGTPFFKPGKYKSTLLIN